MNKPKTRYVKCDDLYIAYQVFGDGPVDLIYAQGWLTNIEYAWESPDYVRFLRKLARFSRVVFFDKRGCGMSDRIIGTPSLEERSRDIVAIMDAIGSERAAFLGMSEGGAICSMFAAAYPERTSHLILYGSRPCYSNSATWPHGASPEEIETDINDLIANWGNPFQLDSGAPSAANDPAAAEWFAAYLRYSASPTAAASFTRMNYEIDYRDILSSIHVPTLVYHREDDIWCPLACAQYLAEHIENAQLCIKPGSDHIAWYGDQETLVREIEQFVMGEAINLKPERLLLTMVFMDIVNSTGELARLGDERWLGILKQLDVVVDRRVEAFGGERIKHTGDGYLFAFRGPSSATDYARVLRDDTGSLGLQSRIGIHTGECERLGNDLGGLAVHISARIMGESEPDKIIASQTVKDLMVGSETAFAECRDQAASRCSGGLAALLCRVLTAQVGSGSLVQGFLTSVQRIPECSAISRFQVASSCWLNWVNLTRFHGAFALNSKHRGEVAPAERGKGRAQKEDEDKTPEPRHQVMTWAQRLKRVFNIDVSACPKCGGEAKVIASIEDQPIIDKMLSPS